MQRAGWPIAVGLVFALVVSPAAADDAKVLRNALREAARAQILGNLDSLTVVITQGTGSTASETDLTAFKTELTDLLTAMQIDCEKVVMNPDGDALGAGESDTADGVLVAEFRLRGRARSVKLLVQLGENQLLSRVVALSAAPRSIAGSSGRGSSRGGAAGLPAGRAATGGAQGPTSNQIAAGLNGMALANAAGIGDGATTLAAGAGLGSTDTTQTGMACEKTTTATDGTTTTEETGAAAKSTTVSDVNKAILNYAVGALGTQVGNGECWTLGAEALKAAGAKPPNAYDFGTPVEIANIQPGDILQFTSAVFQSRGVTYTMGAPNHTSVVYTVSGTKVIMLHQNVNNSKIVQTLELDLSTLTSGTVQPYRAESR